MKNSYFISSNFLKIVPRSLVCLLLLRIDYLHQSSLLSQDIIRNIPFSCTFLSLLLNTKIKLSSDFKNFRAGGIEKEKNKAEGFKVAYRKRKCGLQGRIFGLQSILYV